jgi:hypothetical protein
MSYTWNPSDVAPAITLSNFNLTAATSTGGSQDGRGQTSQTSGKYYMEQKVDIFTPATTWAIAISNGTESLTNFPGQTTNSVGWFDSGQVYYNSVPLTTIQTFTTGDTLGMAVDITNALLWFRTNTGNWNNSGSANPSTGTGGISFTVTGALFPMFHFERTGDQGTANFGATTYAHFDSTLTGFLNWDGSNPGGGGTTTILMGQAWF